ncbi:protein fantom-like isoform X2 [Babylonia areolata]|uniref:protein fantom-like isoform X2 n=1 Tax=Babylonia areolata TaxID=304850 RepID=UPI003FD26820
MMADDSIPVKDTSNNAFRSAGPAALDHKATQQRRQVSKWARDELEDKYLRIHEENLLLKKHARKQEDKIKRMATKLLRLVNDKKKQDVDSKGVSIEAEERIMELQEKMLTLEKVNAQLKDKLILAKQQIQAVSGTKRATPYPYVQSRINTGIPKPQTVQIDPRIAKNIRVMGPPVHLESPKRVASPPPAMAQHQRYGHSLLEETRAEKKHLQDTIAQLNEQLNLYEMEIENLKEQNRLREAEYEEDLIKIKTQITSEQRQSVQENIDMIKLQRDVKEKSTRLIALQEKYGAMEENTRVLRHNHDQILVEMERLNVQLKEEQSRVLTLQNELKVSMAAQKRMVELQEQVVDLQRETDTLKEANEKLVGSAFDLEREREWRQRENKLKVQIAQLEATLKSDLGEKGSIIDKYANERDANEKLQQEYRELQIQHFQMKEEYDDLKEKLQFFTKESAVDMTELEDALVLVKQKKQKAQAPPDFIQRVDAELDRDSKKQMLELQAEYAETVHELEKTRNMLVVQHKINKDYQKETELANQQLQDTKKEYELKLDEYARLLDIRAARIKKLEAQLRDVAYGTRQYRVSPPDEDVESSVDLEETLQLERGQNLFEIHITKVSLSEDAVRHIGDEEPSLFCTWEFFEFEIQSTPVVRGSRPMYDFTSQYIVKVDDFFLHYLQKQTCTLELHQTFGQEFHTVAACQLVFRDLFDKPSGRIHGVAALTGVGDGETGVGYGTVEYWIRLRVPMDQALRLYKERTKALGYLSANERQMKENLQALDEEAARRPMDNVNELHIKIIKCSKLKSRRPDVQPSPYCVYQFFNFSDHDTVIVRNSNNPEFHDHRTYPVPMTHDLDEYLSFVHLDIFVFDDADPEEMSYLGKARIPLMSLRQNGELKGPYALSHDEATEGAPDRQQSLGTIHVEIYWAHDYIRPSRPKHTPLEMDVEETPVKLPPSPREHGPARPTLQGQGRGRGRGAPSATSTPMARNKLQEVESQIIEHGATTSMASPKPVARRRVRMVDGGGGGGGADAGGDVVQDTVSQVVQGFMPRMSESISSVAEMSTIQTEREQDSAVVEPSVVEQAPPGGVTAEPYSTEEEELAARPSPPRTSLTLESGSGSASEEGNQSEGSSQHIAPTPRVRSQLHKPEKVQRKRVQKQPSPPRPPPSSAPPPVQSLEDDDDDDDEVGEEIEEEVAEEEEESSTPTPTTPPSAPSRAASAMAQDAKASETEESEAAPIESDSEGVMTVAPPPKRKSRMPKASDRVTVVVSHLSLEEESEVMANPSVQQLFVEYRFLGLPPQDTETPFALPKPRPFHTIAFNFSKTVDVDMEKNYERRQRLAAMLLPDDPDQGRIRFTVVSEPLEDDQDADCEDVGVAYVSMRDILRTKKDIIEQDIDILDPNDESTVVGQMNLTVECLAALQAVDQEMQVEGTY